MLTRLLFSLVGSDKDSYAPGEAHVISGPLGQPANSNIKKKRNPSVLATAFQNAWKQGNLTAEVRHLEGRTGQWEEYSLGLCKAFGGEDREMGGV